MTTLVRAGRFRCDATCHNARGKRCACICGGRLHGKGYAGALGLLAGLEVRLPPGVGAASIHLPAVLPAEVPMDYEHHVTLTVRWSGPPAPEVLAGAMIYGIPDVFVAMGVPGPVDVDARTAPWITIPEEDRANIGRAMVDAGKDRADWWTAKFLQLCAKSDPAHLEALRAAAPDHVEAWERWRATSPADDVDDLLGAPKA